MTRTIAYLRVSTDKQADRGYSLDAQRAKVEAYAQLYDLDLVAVEVDAGVSAKSMERPALQRSLAALKAGEADALLVVKLDRLTRSVVDLGTLLKSYFGPDGVALLSVSEQIDTRTAAGRLVLNVLGAVSQWEREAIGERTAATMRHMRQEGRYTGGEPRYGYRRGPGGHLVPVKEEQIIIDQIRSLAATGISLRAVARKINDRGHRTRKGTHFQATQVKRLLTPDQSLQVAA